MGPHVRLLVGAAVCFLAPARAAVDSVLCPGQNEGDRCYCGAEASGENDCTANPSLCECAEARACCAGEAWDNVVWSTPAYAPPPLRGGAFTDVDGAVKLVVATVDGVLDVWGGADDAAAATLEASTGALEVQGTFGVFNQTSADGAVKRYAIVSLVADDARAKAAFALLLPLDGDGCPGTVQAPLVLPFGTLDDGNFDADGPSLDAYGKLPAALGLAVAGAAPAFGLSAEHVAVLAGGGAGALFLDFTDDPLAPAIVARDRWADPRRALGGDGAYLGVATPAGDRFDAVKNMPTTTTTRPPATTTASATTPDAERECSELVRGLEGKAMKQGKRHKLKKPTKKKLKKSCKKKAYCKWKKKTCDYK
ncbi:hypothetical protein JL722_13963 [Aureococcus anophagefferens]|nr:hypothetical protein JL722_13963 [Aureococcus anophagefferens]